MHTACESTSWPATAVCDPINMFKQKKSDQDVPLLELELESSTQHHTSSYSPCQQQIRSHLPRFPYPPTPEFLRQRPIPPPANNQLAVGMLYLQHYPAVSSVSISADLLLINSADPLVYYLVIYKPSKMFDACKKWTKWRLVSDIILCRSQNMLHCSLGYDITFQFISVYCFPVGGAIVRRCIQFIIL